MARKILDIFFYISFFLLTVATFLSFNFFDHYICDIFSQFQVQTAYLALLPVGYFFFKKKYLLLMLSWVLLLFNITPTVGLYIPNQAAVAETSFTLLQMNIWSPNQEIEKVLDEIESKDADIVLIQEIDAQWKLALQPLGGKYPYSKVIAREDKFGIGVYSKLPLEKSEIAYFDSLRNLPSIVIHFQVDGRNITLVNTHPCPPKSPQHYQSRNSQMKAITEYLNTQKGSKIIIGDFNNTSFSKNFRSWKKTAGLYDSRKGFGLQTSWPSGFYPLRISIDHCLLSNDLITLKREIGNNIGSDHLPVFLELGTKPSLISTK
ncbi:endonuclease/exonuclease/phosphatase family protein [Flammeovirgaceae bacterium SG7u.111]|nr:endonuclease/exonuclease/phosphatase family protein [Flammeovirgaceae bacterium SG7u.132]WPO38240.1 endonuclease/exonuclease/phosphatase family protein [Flammeovirgaceae bacterium SG7u.111]